MTAQALLQTLNVVLNSQDGIELDRLLRQSLNVEQTMKKNWLITLNAEQLPKLCSQCLNKPNYREFGASLINTMIHVKKGSMEGAYNSMSNLLKYVFKVN